jgi:hypothetical protein
MRVPIATRLDCERHKRNSMHRYHLPRVVIETMRRDLAMPTRLRRLTEARLDGQEPFGERPKPATNSQLGKEVNEFDIWLRRSLHTAFDAVAAEPIPEDILRMIEEDSAEGEDVRRRRQVKRDE